MSILAFVIGIALPAMNGWLILRNLQSATRVLFRVEEWVMGTVIGLTLTMLCTFLLHTYANVPLTLVGFASVQLGMLIIAGMLFTIRKLKAVPAPAPIARESLPKWTKIVLGFFGLLVIFKTIVASVTFLLLTPTYLDDTVDNWNLRGKVYFVDHALTLVMPGEDAATSPLGVSSYPPTVPLMKTWFASIAGNWNDPLVNSIHALWYIAALVLLYFVLRRLTSFGWSLAGTIILGSMPLYLMHGTNPYGDAFMSVHAFLAVTLAWLAVREEDDNRRASFARIGALAAALLPFTKNEGMLVYLPPLLLLLLLWSVFAINTQRTTMRSLLPIIAWYGVFLAALILPWLMFKWTHGLTFGNAKPFSTLGIGWQEGIVTAISVNTFFEGNWLLLFPLFFTMLLWKWRTAFGTYTLLSVYILIVIGGQWTLYLFTGLASEARMQTGLARGIVQMLPLIVLLTTLLLFSARDSLRNALSIRDQNI